MTGEPIDPSSEQPDFTLSPAATPPENSFLANYASEPEHPAPPMRFPNFADVALASIVLIVSGLLSMVLTRAALYLHLFGVTTLQQAQTEIHYSLGSQTAWYLFSLISFVVIFPSFWHTSFFAGVEWRISTALRMRWHLFSAAAFCVVLAIVDSIAMPGPQNAPIDEVFHRKDAVWLLTIFGTTFAPFFEELIFRGLLLPAFCTACDWAVERFTHRPAPWPDAEGRTQWTLPAMAVGSVLTSIPFSLMHFAQNGGSIGPFLLLVGVSMVLCWVRLSTRSLAASTLVHASYNLLLFALMFANTDGFKHLDKV